MEEYNIFWFEEPVPAEDIEGSAAVAEAIDTPVASGENEFTRWCRLGCLEILLGDIKIYSSGNNEYY